MSLARTEIRRFSILWTGSVSLPTNTPVVIGGGDDVCAATGEIIAIGGGARNETWLQILADIWNARILVSRCVEDATSMGAAMCAGVGIRLLTTFPV